jgi:ADP-ribose pyrophosphatase YjhB (NUDIX family)
MIPGTMEVPRLFEHCPRCGHPQRPPEDVRPDGPFRCTACGLTLFFNPAGAVAALIVRDDDGRALFIRRAKEPGRGKLAMAGGFVDPGESAEQALVREVREETGLDVRGLEYLTSHANRYHYAGVTYHTLDLFFVARVTDADRAGAGDDVQHVVWLAPFEVPLAELAFESMRHALRQYRMRMAPERSE